MRSYGRVTTLEVLSGDSEDRLVRLETTDPLLLEPIRQAGVLFERHDEAGTDADRVRQTA